MPNALSPTVKCCGRDEHEQGDPADQVQRGDHAEHRREAEPFPPGQRATEPGQPRGPSGEDFSRHRLTVSPGCALLQAIRNKPSCGVLAKRDTDEVASKSRSAASGSTPSGSARCCTPAGCGERRHGSRCSRRWSRSTGICRVAEIHRRLLESNPGDGAAARPGDRVPDGHHPRRAGSAARAVRRGWRQHLRTCRETTPPRRVHAIAAPSSKCRRSGSVRRWNSASEGSSFTLSDQAGLTLHGLCPKCQGR